jgi:hypothetical protein
MKDQRSEIPNLLDVFRGKLGDAGIPHTLRRTKNGWPYIRFDAPALGHEVSVQYRRRRTDRETHAVRDAHFLAFLPIEGSTEQATRSFVTDEELLSFLGIDDRMRLSNRENRESLSQSARAISILPPEIEHSYIANMRT